MTAKPLPFIGDSGGSVISRRGHLGNAASDQVDLSVFLLSLLGIVLTGGVSAWLILRSTGRSMKARTERALEAMQHRHEVNDREVERFRRWVDDLPWPPILPGTPERRQLHPMLRGLLDELPERGKPWGAQGRQQWLTTAEQVFRLIYPCDSPTE